MAVPERSIGYLAPSTGIEPPMLPADTAPRDTSEVETLRARADALEEENASLRAMLNGRRVEQPEKHYEVVATGEVFSYAELKAMYDAVPWGQTIGKNANPTSDPTGK